MEADAIRNIPHGRAVSYKPHVRQAIRYISFDDTSHNGGFGEQQVVPLPLLEEIQEAVHVIVN